MESDSRKWNSPEARLTAVRLYQKFNRNESFERNLIELSQFLMQQLLHLCNRMHAVHIFINSSESLDEAHLLLYGNVEFKGRTNKAGAIDDRNQFVLCKKKGIPKWFSEKNWGKPGEFENVPNIISVSDDELHELFEHLSIKYDVEKVEKENDADVDKEHGVLVPFTKDGVDLGYFLLWRKRNHGKEDEIIKTFWGRVVFLNDTLLRLLQDEYQVTEETYLPSYYNSGWKPVSIMFADIRNFTPMTELMRDLYAKSKNERGPLREIINDYCSAMAKIINANGRVDKFMGDGILAIFGEYEKHPSATVCKAVSSACNMLEKFSELNNAWKKGVLSRFFEIEYNETIEYDVELGIGIDYGTVLFDYFGDDSHKEYSVLGDHVNFAQRLEGHAAKSDPITNAKNPPILISKTAYRCCYPWLIKEKVVEIEISPKGKKNNYKVYGFGPDAFIETSFGDAVKNGKWDEYWKHAGAVSPLEFMPADNE